MEATKQLSDRDMKVWLPRKQPLEGGGGCGYAHTLVSYISLRLPQKSKGKCKNPNITGQWFHWASSTGPQVESQTHQCIEPIKTGTRNMDVYVGNLVSDGPRNSCYAATFLYGLCLAPWFIEFTREKQTSAELTNCTFSHSCVLYANSCLEMTSTVSKDLFVLLFFIIRWKHVQNIAKSLSFFFFFKGR